MTNEEVTILIFESALEQMELREQRMIRELRRRQEELDMLGNEIRQKKFALSAARDAFLRRCV